MPQLAFSFPISAAGITNSMFSVMADFFPGAIARQFRAGFHGQNQRAQSFCLAEPGRRRQHRGAVHH